MNVVLVGFMASGKTAVGRRIANRLGYGFVDMDHFIENEVGCTIAELFEHKGEAHFRSLETRLISHLYKLDNHVISTGGGIVTTDGNLEALREVGLTVFLNADPGEILQRLARDTRRPKLKEGGLEETVTRLLGERMARYRQTDLIIDTRGKSLNRVAGEIIHALADFAQPVAHPPLADEQEAGSAASGEAAPAASDPEDPDPGASDLGASTPEASAANPEDGGEDHTP